MFCYCIDQAFSIIKLPMRPDHAEANTSLAATRRGIFFECNITYINDSEGINADLLLSFPLI
jgi:hypothetical protein